MLLGQSMSVYSYETKEMNILYLGLNIGPHIGGVERTSCITGTYLKKHGNNVYYGYRYKDESSLPESEKLHYSFNTSQEDFNACLADFIRGKSIDVVICQGVWSHLLRRFIRRYRHVLGFKVIYCLHLAPNDYVHTCHGAKYRLKNFVCRTVTGIDIVPFGQRRIYNLCDRYVLLSPTHVEETQRLCRLSDTSKISVIPNPLSFATVVGAHEKKEKEVLMVCRLTRQKNVEAALRIWQIIEKQNRTDWNLVIVGNGEEEQSLKCYAESLQLHSVIFKGKQCDVESFYRRASIFIMTSIYEGFGITLIEAQQSGCVPVVFDTFSALHDIISDGTDGCIIDFSDEQAFARRVIQLMDNEDERMAMATAARQSSQRFSVERVCRQWNDLLETLVKTNSGTDCDKQ